jgi:hypothetical protein
MIPKMPALIPANTVTPNPSIQASLFKAPESPGPSPLPIHRITLSDEELHKDLDNQIQLVKQIQTILGTEQIKLEMMIKQFNTQNKKRKETTVSANQKLEPKYLRVCSPSYINRNLSIDKNQKSAESDLTSREKEELERFRNFWSGSNGVFEDEEIEIKEELNSFDFADLVEEELSNRR